MSSFLLRPLRGPSCTLLRRRLYSTFGQPVGKFEPLVPPPPSSLPKPKPASEQWPRTRKYTLRLLYLSAICGGLYGADVYFNYGAVSRNLRTLYVGALIAADYKLNFTPGKAEGIDGLHERNAKRVFNLLSANGGLYLKIGQAIAMQSAALPPSFQREFAKFFDDAPMVSYDEVEKVFKEEMGKTPQEIFEWFDKRAVASASVAQVHRAKLKTGEQVAVKVQKPAIRAQIELDLASYRLLMYLYEYYLFHIPVYFVVDFISSRLRSECDFLNEASNSSKMRSLILAEPLLSKSVYIPAVYPAYTTGRILTAEWIDGTRLWDRDGITSPPLSPARQKRLGRKGGLGLREKDVMQVMVDLFSAQMFLFGTVHCDPHPGNIFIRPRKDKPSKPELVLIDHGLYITESDELRRNYARLWKALLTFDNRTIAEIASGWGIGHPDFFASATLLRPYEGGDGEVRGILTGQALVDDGKGGKRRMNSFEIQSAMRDKLKEFLADTSRIPQELVFLERNMRIVQGNNQYLGSPVNRIRIMATWASKALAMNASRYGSFGERVRGSWEHFKFRFVLFGLDVVFWGNRIRQLVFGGGGFEDVLEGRMKEMAKEMGVELNHGVFDG